jgi:hypothetical protein
MITREGKISDQARLELLASMARGKAQSIVTDADKSAQARLMRADSERPRSRNSLAKLEKPAKELRAASSAKKLDTTALR